jgi:hypothetical protein
MMGRGGGRGGGRGEMTGRGRGRGDGGVATVGDDSSGGGSEFGKCFLVS